MWRLLKEKKKEKRKRKINCGNKEIKSSVGGFTDTNMSFSQFNCKVYDD